MHPIGTPLRVHTQLIDSEDSAEIDVSHITALKIGDDNESDTIERADVNHIDEGSLQCRSWTKNETEFRCSSEQSIRSDDNDDTAKTSIASSSTLSSNEEEERDHNDDNHPRLKKQVSFSTEAIIKMMDWTKKEMEFSCLSKQSSCCDDDNDETAKNSIASSNTFSSNEEECEYNNKDYIFKKRVSFSTEAFMGLIQHHREFTKEEKERAWHTKADYQRISDENEATIDFMIEKNKELHDKEKLCIRGLEGCTPQRSRIRDIHRSRAYLAVFEEQDDQFYWNIHDVETIARKYRKASRYCSYLSQKMGILDEIYTFNSDYMRKTIVSLTPFLNNNNPSRKIMRCDKTSLQCLSTIPHYSRSTRKIGISNDEKVTTKGTVRGNISRKKKRALQHASTIHFPLRFTLFSLFASKKG